jgi:hypothetical protein
VLWNNSQERHGRELKARLTEGYQFTRDALIEVVSAALGDKTQRPLPSYARSNDASAPRGMSGAALEAALAGWAMEFPDHIKRVVN